jgi:hypothetical protein
MVSKLSIPLRLKGSVVAQLEFTYTDFGANIAVVYNDGKIGQTWMMTELGFFAITVGTTIIDICLLDGWFAGRLVMVKKASHLRPNNCNTHPIHNSKIKNGAMTVDCDIRMIGL